MPFIPPTSPFGKNGRGLPPPQTTKFKPPSSEDLPRNSGVNNNGKGKGIQAEALNALLKCSGGTNTDPIAKLLATLFSKL